MGGRPVTNDLEWEDINGTTEELMLTATNGVTLVDTLALPPLAMDASWARFPDQSGSAIRFNHPTPGQPNRLPAPVITGVMHTPSYPQAGETTTVRARIVDDSRVARAELIYKTGETSATVTMYDDGQHDDGAANDSLYAGQIPALPNRTVVQYYIAAIDEFSRTAFHPFAAPTLTHDYRVGFLPPPVAISES